MSERGAVVVLAEGGATLTSHVERLRNEGWRVFLTSRLYQAAFLVAKRPVSTFIAMRTLLPPDAEGDFLRQIREFEPRPLTVVYNSAEADPGDLTGIVDLWLTEPFAFADLLAVLECGAGRTRREDPESEASSPASPVSIARETGRPLPVIYRVILASRELTELERDREQLLSHALEVFMDLTDSERGSIMLRYGDSLRAVRRAGFPPEAESFLEVPIGGSLSGSVFTQDEPLLVPNVAALGERARTDRGYHGSSFLIVPIKNRHETMGVVNLTNHRGRGPYREEDQVHAMMIADQLAVTLRNARTLTALRAMAVIDPLTQLHNRRHFDRQLKSEIERARRYGRQLTLALIDIDNFKIFNDVNGYATGDEILKRVGRIILESFREVDVVTRWGGDEFAVILPETGPPAADRVAPENYIERVRAAVAETDFSQQVPGLAGRITLSVGVATYPDDGGDETDLFRQANLALHRAKKLGNNRTCFAQDLLEG